ncbi:hypothetical protein EVAR_91502_1 [Eumeta japonica]|uniref:Uncharacterized protein n=1 Tax=Eumeta variegata TaxID=151549 RepID=A0A4C1VAT6_EUMVA|nr:hypothetical protein EVAR_91502_1 [Eumeta japonica]
MSVGGRGKPLGNYVATPAPRANIMLRLDKGFRYLKPAPASGRPHGRASRPAVGSGVRLARAAAAGAADKAGATPPATPTPHPHRRRPRCTLHPHAYAAFHDRSSPTTQKCMHRSNGLPHFRTLKRTRNCSRGAARLRHGATTAAAARTAETMHRERTQNLLSENEPRSGTKRTLLTKS